MQVTKAELDARLPREIVLALLQGVSEDVAQEEQGGELEQVTKPLCC
jgi:hypothetical protein